MIGFLPFWGVRGLVCLQKEISRLVLPAGWLLVAFCLGGARYQAVLPQIGATDLAYYNDAPESLVLDGWLLEPADLRDQYSLLRLRVDRMRLPGQGQALVVDGQLLVRTAPGVPWQYGDRLRLDGWLVNAPEQEDFSYRQYLARQGIYSYMTTNSILRIGGGEGSPLIAAAYRMRQRALDLVYQYWPDPDTSLLAGILLGVETGIPADVAAAFRDTGTAHIFAISGYNVIIFARLLSTLLTI